MSTIVRVDVVPGEIIGHGASLAADKIDQIWHVRIAKDGDHVIGHAPTEDEAENLSELPPGLVYMKPTRQWAKAVGWVGGA